MPTSPATVVPLTLTPALLGGGTSAVTLPWFDVTDVAYGAIGDGAADDTAAIQAAINDASVTNGGLVYFPAGTYRITSALSIPGGSGGFTAGGITLFGDHRDSTCIEQATSNIAILKTGDASYSMNVTVTDLRLQYAAQQATTDTQAYAISWDGNPSVLVSWTIDRCWINRSYVGIGISATSGAVASWNVRISNTWITSTRHNAIKLSSPTAVGMPSNYFDHLYIANTGVGGLGGVPVVPDGTAIELAAASVVMTDIDLEGWYNKAVHYEGNTQALTVRGFYIEHHVMNNLGTGGSFPFLFYCASNSIWDSVHISGAVAASVGAYLFIANAGVAMHLRGVSSDLTIDGTSYASGVSAGTGARVHWLNDWTISSSSTGTLNLPGDAGTGTDAIVGGTRALTYSATIATDASLPSDIFRIVATNGTAFTISNPTKAWAGRRISYDIKNSSGGAMGVITWGAAFKLAGAFTNPANGKLRTISFYYDGTNWVETNRAAADI